LPALFNAETGERIPPSKAYRDFCNNNWSMGVRTATAGRELMVLDEHTVLQGGYPLLGNPDIRHDKAAAKFLAFKIDDDGSVPLEPLPWWAIPHSQLAPAADDTHITFTGGVTKSTTLLVVGDQDVTKLAGHSKSSKHRKAEANIENGQPIRILRETDFLMLLDTAKIGT